MLYSITSRGNAGQDIFLGDEARRAFLEILGRAAIGLRDIATAIA